MLIFYIYGIVVWEEGEYGWFVVCFFVQWVVWFDVEVKLWEYVVLVLWFEKFEDVLLEQVYWGDLGVQFVFLFEFVVLFVFVDFDFDVLVEWLEGQVCCEILVQVWLELIEVVWVIVYDQDLCVYWQMLEFDEQWNVL